MVGYKAGKTEIVLNYSDFQSYKVYLSRLIACGEGVLVTGLMTICCNTRCKPCKGKEHLTLQLRSGSTVSEAELLRFFLNIIYEMDEESPKFRDKVV